MRSTSVLRLQVMPDGVLPAAQLTLLRLPLVYRLPEDADPLVHIILGPVLDPLVVTVGVDLQGWLQPMT